MFTCFDGKIGIPDFRILSENFWQGIGHEALQTQALKHKFLSL
jgi:hypothetical protein